MKHLACGSVLTIGLLLLATTARAQDSAPAPCGSDVSALRGTYAFTAIAVAGLSEVDPMLPKGYAPVTILGAFKVNGNGDVTGWASPRTLALSRVHASPPPRLLIPHLNRRIPSRDPLGEGRRRNSLARDARPGNGTAVGGACRRQRMPGGRVGAL